MLGPTDAAMDLLSLTDILNHFHDDINAFRRGEDKFKSGRVLYFYLDKLTITAKVQATMKDKTYKVIVSLKSTGGIDETQCECPRGKWICSHIAAALIYAEKIGISKTDVPASWIKHPKKKLRQGALLFSDLFPESKPGYTALRKPISEEDILDFHASLMDADHKCGMAWVISPTLELDDNSGLPPFVRDLRHLDELALKKELICSEEQIKKAEENTRAQRNNPLWSKLRHLRLAAR